MCHPRECGDPDPTHNQWIPACAGMTPLVANIKTSNSGDCNIKFSFKDQASIKKVPNKKPGGRRVFTLLHRVLITISRAVV